MKSARQRKCEIAKSRYLKFAGVTAVVAIVSLAPALPTFFDRFNLLYKPSADSELGKAGCRACHSIEDGPPRRNPFGARVEQLINHANDGTPNGGVTTDDLIYVEKEDSDGDGYTNLEEIVAGTLPGDPQSHPKSHSTNLPKHEMSRKFDRLHLRVTGGLFALGVICGTAGKFRKKTYLSKSAVIAGVLGLVAFAGTMLAFVFSNRHP